MHPARVCDPATGSSGSLVAWSLNSLEGRVDADRSGRLGNPPFRASCRGGKEVRHAELVQRGRAVRTLKAGRYAVAVHDTDPHAGFFVQAGGHRALAVAGVDFVGKRTQRITLTAGTWTYFAAKGTAKRFTVVP